MIQDHIYKSVSSRSLINIDNTRSLSAHKNKKKEKVNHQELASPPTTLIRLDSGNLMY